MARGNQQSTPADLLLHEGVGRNGCSVDDGIGATKKAPHVEAVCIRGEPQRRHEPTLEGGRGG